VHRLSQRNWEVPNPLSQTVNKGGGLWCFESKNLEGWWGQDFERSFLKMLLKALIWVLYQKKLKKICFDVCFVCFLGGKYREMEFGFVYFFIPMWFFGLSAIDLL
jgi:hypothetical protein